MAQDYKQIASQAVASLQQAEQQIKNLKAQLAMTKQASFDSQLIDQTVNAMIKCGSLTEADKAEAAKILAADNNASLRALKAVCQASVADAEPIVKTAAQDLNCGTLVSGITKEASKASPAQDKHADYATVAKALKLKLK